MSKVKADGLKAAGADLSEARVSFSDMSGADFSGARLRKMDFHESCADGANFEKAALCGSTFCWGSSARDANFTGAELDGAELDEHRGGWRGLHGRLRARRFVHRLRALVVALERRGCGGRGFLAQPP